MNLFRWDHSTDLLMPLQEEPDDWLYRRTLDYPVEVEPLPPLPERPITYWKFLSKDRCLKCTFRSQQLAPRAQVKPHTCHRNTHTHTDTDTFYQSAHTAHYRRHTELCCVPSLSSSLSSHYQFECNNMICQFGNLGKFSKLTDGYAMLLHSFSQLYLCTFLILTMTKTMKQSKV